jgi:hypothetical protein
MQRGSASQALVAEHGLPHSPICTLFHSLRCIRARILMVLMFHAGPSARHVSRSRSFAPLSECMRQSRSGPELLYTFHKFTCLVMNCAC